jgi:flagellar basal-body rod protein FlgB
MDLGSSSALTIESVRLALGAAGMRQRVIADNIANVNSPDHVRMRVVFEERLAEAMSSMRNEASGESSGGPSLASLSGIQAEVEPDNTVGSKVELDEEMARLSANSLRYHALTKGLSRYLSIANIIASSSKG